MATKEELSAKLNQILGLEDEIDFTKLPKSDLEKLIEVLNPTNMIALGVKQIRTRAREQILERKIKDILEKPLVEGILTEKREGGLLGLGILPAIREALRGKQRG